MILKPYLLVTRVNPLNAEDESFELIRVTINESMNSAPFLLPHINIVTINNLYILNMRQAKIPFNGLLTPLQQRIFRIRYR